MVTIGGWLTWYRTVSLHPEAQREGQENGADSRVQPQLPSTDFCRFPRHLVVELSSLWALVPLLSLRMGEIKCRKVLPDQSLVGTHRALVAHVGQRIGETGVAGA